MGAICSCGRYSQHYVDDWSEEDVIQSVTPMVESSPTKLIYKGGGGGGGAENRSLEKLVEAGLIEADTYLMFKNTTIRELGIVRNRGEGIFIEFEGEHMSLAKFCKKGAAKHGKTWNGTPWNSVYTINEDDEPLDRIDALWNRMKKEESFGNVEKEE
jgi:hypothetical protein